MILLFAIFLFMGTHAPLNAATPDDICPFGSMGAVSTARLEAQETTAELIESSIIDWVISEPEALSVLGAGETKLSDMPEAAAATLVWDYLSTTFDPALLRKPTLTTQEALNLASTQRRAGITVEDFQRIAKQVGNIVSENKVEDFKVALAKALPNRYAEAEKRHVARKMVGTPYRSRAEHYSSLDPSFNENHSDPLAFSNHNVLKEVYASTELQTGVAGKIYNPKLWTPLIERLKNSTGRQVWRDPAHSREVHTQLHEALERRVIAMRFIIKDLITLKGDLEILKGKVVALNEQSREVLDTKLDQAKGNPTPAQLANIRLHETNNKILEQNMGNMDVSLTSVNGLIVTATKVMQNMEAQIAHVSQRTSESVNARQSDRELLELASFLERGLR